MTGARIDRDVVERRLTHLLQAVHVLKEYQSLSLTKLSESPKIYWAVQHGLQLCVQSVLDIAAHFVTALGDSVPDTYRDNILALAPLGVLPHQFAIRLAPMAGFRNILVREYIDVDLQETHRVLTDHLDDFPTFARYVHEFMEQN